MLFTMDNFICCQEFVVAVGIGGASLRHTMAETGQSWISQV